MLWLQICSNISVPVVKFDDVALPCNKIKIYKIDLWKVIIQNISKLEFVVMFPILL